LNNVVGRENNQTNEDGSTHHLTALGNNHHREVVQGFETGGLLDQRWNQSADGDVQRHRHDDRAEIFLIKEHNYDMLGIYFFTIVFLLE